MKEGIIKKYKNYIEDQIFFQIGEVKDSNG